MRKAVFLFLVITLSIFASEPNSKNSNDLITINIVKENRNWTLINKKAIYKLIIENRKMKERLQTLENRLDGVTLSKKSNNTPDNLYIVKTYMANIRSCPSIKCDIVDVLRKGDVAKIVKIKKKWGSLSENRWISMFILEKKR